MTNFGLLGVGSNWTGSTAFTSEPEIAVYLGPDNLGTEIITSQSIPVNFNNVPQGATKPLTFTIENFGSVDLDIDAIDIVGVDFMVPTSTPFSIAPGNTANFVVELTASVDGIANASIDITNTDPDEGAFIFPVTGTKGILVPKAYWTDETGTMDDQIDRSDLDGGNLENGYYSGFSVDIRGIDVDTKNNMVFWSTTDAELKCFRIADGPIAVTNTILSEAGASAQEFRGLAVDGEAGHVYWCDDENEQIRRINFDGTDPQVLINVNGPRDIALDIPGGKMYYVVLDGAPQLFRADLDGDPGSIELVYSSGSTRFDGVALDLVNRDVYWTESAGGVSRAGMGEMPPVNPQVVTFMPSEPEGIALDVENEMVYITDGTNNEIARVSFDGSGYEVIASTDVNNPQHISLDPRSVIPATVIYVNAGAGGANNGTSWTDAFQDLQDALAIAGPGDQVWVAQGIYRPSNSDRNISFDLANSVEVYGGFAGAKQIYPKEMRIVM